MTIFELFSLDQSGRLMVSVDIYVVPTGFLSHWWWTSIELLTGKGASWNGFGELDVDDNPDDPG